MLHEKDQLFNWVVPNSGSRSRNKSDFRVNFKHGNLYIGRDFLLAEYTGIDLTSVRVAFLLEGKTPFLVVNPRDGVPFYKFASYINAAKKQNSPTCGSKQLTKLFRERFLITEEFKDFKLEKFQEINGMMFYHIVLI